MQFKIFSKSLHNYFPKILLDGTTQGAPSATNPFLSSAPAPAQQTSQNQQIMDLFSSPGAQGGQPAQQPVAAPSGGGSNLDDLLSLGIGGPTNGNGSSAPVQTSNPFADMFSSAPPQQKMNAFGGNGYAQSGQMSMGGMGAQGQFYQQPPMIQQPYGGGGNMNNVFGSNNEQGIQLVKY